MSHSDSFPGSLPCEQDGLGMRLVPHLALLSIPGCLSSEEDGEGGRLGALGDVNDLLQTGNTEGDILRRHASVVEGVESHLRGWLPQRLSCQRSHHLTRLSLGQEERKKDYWSKLRTYSFKLQHHFIIKMF